MFSNQKKITQELVRSFGKQKNEDFDFDLISKYFRGKDNSNAFQVISEKTCNDLDLHELFKYLDRTNSKVGQQYLYYKLRTIPHSSLKDEESIIQSFINSKELRLSVQKKLLKLNSFEAYYITSLFQETQLKAPKWFFIIRVLSFTAILSILLLFVNQQIFLVLLGVFILNMLIHFWNKNNLYQYLVSIPQLLRLINVAEELANDKHLGRIESTVPQALKELKNIKTRLIFFNMEAKTAGDMAALAWGIIELLKILFLVEPLLLFGTLKKLDAKRKEIDELFCFVGKIDALVSTASLRSGNPHFCIPIICKEQTISASEIYHPLIHDCVENDISIRNKSILLTGSNMSGKTSFIRAIGVNVLTGLTLNTCFAEKFVMPKMRLFSAIRISDDLLNNRSYYFEEVTTIKSMLDSGQEDCPNLFLLDEIFKGTNTVERISAGKAVLSFLNENKNIVVVSTHDIELAELLSESYDLYHFSENVENRSVDFDYKLKKGKLENRNAIRILEINNYPGKIIQEALELAKRMDKTVNEMADNAV